MSVIYLLDAPATLDEEDKYKKINWPNSNSDPDDIFIVFNQMTPLNARLQYYDIPSESLVIVAKKGDDLAKLINKEKENFQDDYAVFSGTKFKTSNKEVKKEALRQIKLLAFVMYEMLDAGFLEEKKEKKISDWIISFEEPILKLFINYHRIETSNASLSIEDEYIINPQFRKMILIMLMKIVANFIVNNSLATIEEVSVLGSWLEKKTWYALREKIKLLK